VLREQAKMSVLRRRYESLPPTPTRSDGVGHSGSLYKQVGAELGCDPQQRAKLLRNVISEVIVKAHGGQLLRKMRGHFLAGLVAMSARLKLRREEQI
jgi:hypothetical protein